MPILPRKNITPKVAQIVAKAMVLGVDIQLPVDYTLASIHGTEATRAIDYGDEVPFGMLEMDIGHKTAVRNANTVRGSKTIIWYGTMGACDPVECEAGTKSLMDAVVDATRNGAVSLVTGSDVVKILKKYNCRDKVTHASIRTKSDIASLVQNVPRSIDGRTVWNSFMEYMKQITPAQSMNVMAHNGMAFVFRVFFAWHLHGIAWDAGMKGSQ